MNEQYWQAVAARDGQFDGVFFYAVRTTGVYCRPSCASRRPRPENVTFFGSPAAAEDAGFRACRRCEPAQAGPYAPSLELVARVCRYLEQQHERPPTLAELAERFAVSPFHLQRTFKAALGVSPRAYADAQRQARLRAELQAGSDVTGALYDAGYGSSSAFYRHGGTLGMPPASYREGGAALTIGYTVVPCPLGLLLVAATAQGVCTISLGGDEGALLGELRREFVAAELRRDDDGLTPWVEQILAFVAGTQPSLDLPLDIQASAFQRAVWEALRAIPYGATRSYGEVAQAIGRPTASRAVARACATNPVALAIPCHRVVRGSGELGGYRWGIERKQALLAQEAGGTRHET